MSDRSRVKGGDEPLIAGTVRIWEHGHEFSEEFAPGDVAVIDVMDLDRKSATYLLTLEPVAVLNCACSATGRAPSMGAGLLVDAGVVLVDNLGSDASALREGDEITIIGDGVFRDSDLIASGVRQTKEHIAQSRSQSRQRLGAGVRAHATVSAEHFGREEELILSGTGLPDFSQTLQGRNVLVIEDLPEGVSSSALRRLIQDQDMIIIAAGIRGVQCATELGKRPDYIVGDPGLPADRVFKDVRAVVLLERPDGKIPGGKTMRERSLSHFTVPTSFTDLDVALLLAAHNGASLVVECSPLSDMETLVDAGGSAFSGALFVRAQLTDRLVGVKAALKLGRPASIGWLLVLLLVAAILVIVAAILFTPWGESLTSQGSNPFFGFASESSSSTIGRF